MSPNMSANSPPIRTCPSLFCNLHKTDHEFSRLSYWLVIAAFSIGCVMSYINKTTTTFLAAIAFTTTISEAQIPERMGDENAGTGHFGITALAASEYYGSDDNEIQVLPYLSLDNVKGFDFFGTALTYRAVDIGTGQGLGKWSLRAGPRIAYLPGRDSSDSPYLAGFEDIDGSFPIGGYAFGTIGPVGLRLDVGQDLFGSHDGLTVDGSIGTAYTTDKFGFQPSATVSWANNNFSDSFFGVTNDQSLISGLDAFNPGAGIYGYSVNTIAWYEFTKNYSVVLTGSYRWFTDDAADSPILNTSDGSRNGFLAGLSFVRKFDTNNW